MQIALPELKAPATLILDDEKGLSDEQYLRFCKANPDLRLERTAQGEIVIVPPAGGDSDYRCADTIGQLRNWARRDGRGKAFGSSIQFWLPNGAALSPDAAWVSNQRLARLTKKQRGEFLRLAPEFVVEVMSPSDRLAAAQRKMREWLANGVELAWLIHGDARRVYVYRQGCEPQLYSGIETLAGEGPVEGFTLELGEIWAGL
ncbi:MAG: Uma2 family endonuclease [Bryobacteraceae bacterium]|jgi:Uma2 family endonuclease